MIYKQREEEREGSCSSGAGGGEEKGNSYRGGWPSWCGPGLRAWIGGRRLERGARHDAKKPANAQRFRGAQLLFSGGWPLKLAWCSAWYGLCFTANDIARLRRETCTRDDDSAFMILASTIREYCCIAH